MAESGREVAVAAYRWTVYALFLASFAYAIGFVGNLWWDKTIDAGGTAEGALIWNLAWLGLFAVEHSGMARRGFKKWWTRILPAEVERSTYVLAASLALALLFWQWRPMPQTVWKVEHPAVRAVLLGVFWAGWGMVVVSTCLIDHRELFGLRPGAPEFQTPGLYRYVRHPIYLGFTIAFWATPQMTAGHLLFAAAATGYILVGIRFEERDLMARFGPAYARYRKAVPMILPGLRKR